MDKDVLANLMKRFPMKVLPNGNIRTCPVRISFPKIDKPRQDDNGNDKFEATLLFPKGADILILNKALEAKAVEIHGAKAMELVKHGKLVWPLKDQATKIRDDGTLWDGCEAGARTCDARTSNAPQTVDANAQRVAPSKFYGGCWALVTVHPYAGTYEDKKKGAKKLYLSVGLNNLQFIADDDRFGGNGGATDPDEEFEPLDGTAPSGFEGAGADAGKDPYDFG